MTIELPNHSFLVPIDECVVPNPPLFQTVTIACRQRSEDVDSLVLLLSDMKLVAKPLELLAWVSYISEEVHVLVGASLGIQANDLQVGVLVHGGI
jgi:hypothetical protein